MSKLYIGPKKQEVLSKNVLELIGEPIEENYVDLTVTFILEENGQILENIPKVRI